MDEDIINLNAFIRVALGRIQQRMKSKHPALGLPQLDPLKIGILEKRLMKLGNKKVYVEVRDGLEMTKHCAFLYICSRGRQSFATSDRMVTSGSGLGP